MAIIDQQTSFDPDRLPACVVGIAADIGNHDSGLHQHQKGQLLFAPQGCIRFALDDSICILPPTKAVWIPSGTRHRAIMTNVVAYRSIYFDCHAFKCPDHITMIEVNALLKALIDKMALWSWDTPQESMNNTTTLFWEEFYAAQRQTFHLPLPTNRRFKVFRKQLMQATFFAPDLVSLANSVGASSKTVTRLFKAETGMSYQEWKQQWRLLKAIELLSKETPVNQVSDWLGFSSDSAFIAFFKKQTGQTPLSFIKNKALAD
ncbi:AraC family transcriptional regulator [Vibrio cholerae]|uniref:AraC family transcriptional regulator n=2 Tax=Vibrio TaxID=662 RepID=A0ABD7G0Q8_9VIBR|nr:MULTISPECIES: helix-turn-helix transcriptional regulator [Vibrio]EGR1093560.1 AraC family transcriptional regulator [Vibrio cholerae]EGR2507400.1 AraC family transcriptional regulator [Vibrio cholerae]EGR3962666.1 AraC family transcriptional regulator [Vibrio cholerae]EGR3967006.1 AraC family transcriptional regulator [Vibrio cholerae]EJI2331522.1 helix-turn-helix transcriptional regulator [Vibrio cholerae]